MTVCSILRHGQLFQDTRLVLAVIVAENLRKLIESTHFQGGETQPLGKITVSIGVATFLEDGKAGSLLTQRVDQAVYRAKESGRNCVVLFEQSPDF
ncbi:MAG: diguanylate cyclase [Pseudomonadota bacterium]|nr:diguanylate cyclase [Pseudomonadota bacterium]